MPQENEKIIDQGSRVTEETPILPTPGVGKGTKNKIVWWVLGIIILIGIGYGAYWFGQNQKSKIKGQNDNVKLKNIETPITQTPTSPSTSVINEPSTTTVPVDPTADWKTYTNDTYGFSFKYPGDWTKKLIENNLIVLETTDKYGFNLTINRSSSNAEAKTVYNLSVENGLLNTGKILNKNTGLDGISSKPFFDNNNEYQIIYYFPKENTIADKQIFDQILSTFKFTK